LSDNVARLENHVVIIPTDNAAFSPKEFIPLVDDNVERGGRRQNRNIAFFRTVSIKWLVRERNWQLGKRHREIDGWETGGV